MRTLDWARAAYTYVAYNLTICFRSWEMRHHNSMEIYSANNREWLSRHIQLCECVCECGEFIVNNAPECRLTARLIRRIRFEIEDAFNSERFNWNLNLFAVRSIVAARRVFLVVENLNFTKLSLNQLRYIARDRHRQTLCSVFDCELSHRMNNSGERMAALNSIRNGAAIFVFSFLFFFWFSFSYRFHPSTGRLQNSIFSATLFGMRSTYANEIFNRLEWTIRPEKSPILLTPHVEK